MFVLTYLIKQNYAFLDDFCVFEINNLNQENCRESKVPIKTILPKKTDSKKVPKTLKGFTTTLTSSERNTKNTVNKKKNQSVKKTISTNNTCIKITLEEVLLSVCNFTGFFFADH